MPRKKKEEPNDKENIDVEKPAPKKVKKKTYTIEEKAVILKDIFSLNHEVYSIKELEKMVPKKSNGVINSMQMKEVLDYCINENMVSCEKCGISNVYYCFPMLQKRQDKNLLLKQKNSLKVLEKEIAEVEEEYENIVNTKQQWITDNETLNKLKNEEAEIENEVQKLQTKLDACDTTAIQNNMIELKTQSNSLRDNIYSLTSFIKDKMNFHHLSDTHFLNSIEVTDPEIEILNDYEE